MDQNVTAPTPEVLTSKASKVTLIPGVHPTVASGDVMQDESLKSLALVLTLVVLLLVLLCVIVGGMMWYSKNQKGSYVTNETKDGKDNKEDKGDEEEQQSKEPLKTKEEEDY